MPLAPSPSVARRAVLALLLVAPAQSVGAVAAFWVATGTSIGGWIYAAAKVWICVLPLHWHFLVERRRAEISRLASPGFIAGILSGLLISAAIIVTYLLLGPDRVGIDTIRKVTFGNGLDTPLRYVSAALAISFINALLEEFTFRWFITEQCRRLLPTTSSVLLSAAIFTAHHVIVLKAFFGWPITLLASAGVAMGGLIWAWLYLRFNSIWPGYVSHIFVDLAVMTVGWHLLFGVP